MVYSKTSPPSPLSSVKLSIEILKISTSFLVQERSTFILEYVSFETFDANGLIRHRGVVGWGGGGALATSKTLFIRC